MKTLKIFALAVIVMACASVVAAQVTMCVAISGLKSEAVTTVPTDTAKAVLCEAVLDGCVEAGLLDEAGKVCYDSIKVTRNVAAYMELIDEAQMEDCFYDTVGETDEWLDYILYVVEATDNDNNNK